MPFPKVGGGKLEVFYTWIYNSCYSVLYSMLWLSPNHVSLGGLLANFANLVLQIQYKNIKPERRVKSTGTIANHQKSLSIYNREKDNWTQTALLPFSTFTPANESFSIILTFCTSPSNLFPYKRSICLSISWSAVLKMLQNLFRSMSAHFIASGEWMRSFLIWKKRSVGGDLSLRIPV